MTGDGPIVTIFPNVTPIKLAGEGTVFGFNAIRARGSWNTTGVEVIVAQ